MTAEKYAELAMAVVADSRLSPEATLLVLHVLGRGPGGHEITMPEMSGLMRQATAPRIRAAIAQAKAFGWLDHQAQTGKGHSPRYEFIDARIADGTDRVMDFDTLNGDVANYRVADSDTLKVPDTDRVTNSDTLNHFDTDRVTNSDSLNGPSRTRDQGDQKTSTSSSSSSAGARAGSAELATSDVVGMRRLRIALGEFECAADRMAETHPTGGWPSYLVTAYLDRLPLEHTVVGDIPPPDRPRVIALAMHRFAEAGMKYDSRLFRSFVTTVVREQLAGGGDGSNNTNEKSAAAERSQQYGHLGG